MGKDEGKQTPFERFEEAVKKVLAAPKSEVEKRLAERKKSNSPSSEIPSTSDRQR
jgi:hypothetical protein